MTPRERLYGSLLNEIALGWPAPWHDQDRAAARHRTHGLTLGQEQALDRYIDLITEVAA
jgi:hypothetical protein